MVRMMFYVPIRRIPGQLLMLILCFACLWVPAWAEQSDHSPRLIKLAESFVADAQLSQQEQLPIVVFISQHGCEFCELLRENVLFPMMRSGKLQEQAILRELSLDKGFFILDFDGEQVSGMKFAERYGSAVTPTLLFLGAGGDELVRKRVGISNIEYYGFYLGQSIEEATARIKNSN
jgi:thioredoxin-related protein